MTSVEALKIVLDFVERWNKQDKETEVAKAQGVLEELDLEEVLEKAWMYDDLSK